MEEDIQNYLPTVMFRGTPCISCNLVCCCNVPPVFQFAVAMYLLCFSFLLQCISCILVYCCNISPVFKFTVAIYLLYSSLLLQCISCILVCCCNVSPVFQFAVAMYLLTYVGAMLNGLTLLILGWVGLFSLPRLYRDNQKQIDDAILPLKSKLEELQVYIYYL